MILGVEKVYIDINFSIVIYYKYSWTSICSRSTLLSIKVWTYELHGRL